MGPLSLPFSASPRRAQLVNDIAHYLSKQSDRLPFDFWTLKSYPIDIALNHIAPSAKGTTEPTSVPPKLCRFISAYYAETGGQKRK